MAEDSIGAPLAEPAQAALTPVRRGQRWRITPTLIIGCLLVTLIIVIGIIGPRLSPYSPIDNDLANALREPDSAHWLGTDQFGRDILTRIVSAIGVDLQIGILGTAITLVVGVIIGSIAGYYGGWFDALIGRIIDVLIAFPYIVLILAIVAALGPGVGNIYIAIGVIGWISYARIMRAQIVVVRPQQYVEAARALGISDSGIIARHIIPNTITAALVYAMSDIVLNLRLVAALSFLGLGVQPPTPEWGSMVAEGRPFILDLWGLSTWPGIAVVVVGISFSLLGDGIADLLRPRE